MSLIFLCIGRLRLIRIYYNGVVLQATWLTVDAETIQIDAAGIINTVGKAPEDEMGGVDTPAGGTKVDGVSL